MLEAASDYLASHALTTMAVLLVAMMAIRVPIAVAMGLSSAAYLYLTGLPFTLLVQQVVAKLNSFTLLAVPFFVLAGELMNSSGVTARLIEFSKVLVGHVRGGLAHVNILTSMLLAGMSGSAAADAAMTSRVLVPVMEKNGYTRAYSAAITAASATIGPIIPPSIPMVLVGVVNELSVGRLFFGGLVPGVLIGLGLMSVVYWQAVRRGDGRGDFPTLKIFLHALAHAALPMLTPAIILGGMMGGLFTPTEAAAVAVLYTATLGVLVYRALGWRELYAGLLNSVSITARIMYIVALAGVFGWILSSEQVVDKIGSYLSGVAGSPVVLLLYLNVILLLLGCLLNLVTLVLLLSPIFFPLTQQYGIDPIHFGVVMVVNLMLGQLTPPVGLMSFVVLGVTRVDLASFLKELWPFFLLLLGVLLLVTYVPALVLYVPDAIMGPRLD